MSTQVDQLSDAAMGASKMALQTHDDGHHKAAKQAHEAAYQAASANNRPSLAQHHLQAAALHDQHQDGSTALGKGSAAHRATAKARASGKAEDHDAAKIAHEDAAQAHRDNGGGKPAFAHGEAAWQHGAQAEKIRNPPPKQGQDRPMPVG
jgi:hypothetical protein